MKVKLHVHFGMDRNNDRLEGAEFSDAFLTAPPLQGDTYPVLGVEMITRGATNIADQLFGQRTRGEGESCAEFRRILGEAMK